MKNKTFKEKCLKSIPTKRTVKSKGEIKYTMQTESLENTKNQWDSGASLRGWDHLGIKINNESNSLSSVE